MFSLPSKGSINGYRYEGTYLEDKIFRGGVIMSKNLNNRDSNIISIAENPKRVYNPFSKASAAFESVPTFAAPSCRTFRASISRYLSSSVGRHVARPPHLTSMVYDFEYVCLDS